MNVYVCMFLFHTKYVRTYMYVCTVYAYVHVRISANVHSDNRPGQLRHSKISCEANGKGESETHTHTHTHTLMYIRMYVRIPSPFYHS